MLINIKYNMTLSQRNSFFKIGIFFCAAVILFILIVSFWTVPVYSQIEENTRRPDFIFLRLTGWFIGNSYYALHTALSLAALFSLTGMFLIKYYFERTPTPEILYISFFTISFAFEAFRLFLPLQFIINFPSVYLIISSRILIFARFFSIFSLFTAGLCAAGLEVQKARNAVFLIFTAALVITLGVPINAHSWDTGFNLANGFTSTFRVIELVAFVTTILSFLIAAKARGSNDYVYASVGVFLALTGRNILLGTDNWIGPILGILLLSFGIRLLCSKVHKIHLWL